MTPITLVFQSRESITVYSTNPAAFQESILTTRPPEIMDVQYSDIGHLEETPELQEVRLSLGSGASILCHIAKTDVAKADYIEEITDCSVTHILVYTELMKQEVELDERFKAASLVINNIPDLDVRVDLHREFLKRKSSYISAVEALVDGVIRRYEK